LAVGLREKLGTLQERALRVGSLQVRDVELDTYVARVAGMIAELLPDRLVNFNCP